MTYHNSPPALNFHGSWHPTYPQKMHSMKISKNTVLEIYYHNTCMWKFLPGDNFCPLLMIVAKIHSTK